MQHCSVDELIATVERRVTISGSPRHPSEQEHRDSEKKRFCHTFYLIAKGGRPPAVFFPHSTINRYFFLLVLYTYKHELPPAAPGVVAVTQYEAAKDVDTCLPRAMAHHKARVLDERDTRKKRKKRKTATFGGQCGLARSKRDTIIEGSPHGSGWHGTASLF